MSELIGKLQTAAVNIVSAEKLFHLKMEEWDKEAKNCPHCKGEGGDGLECSHVETNDPFCYSGNCPLINTD
jgi:hypothetical protein